ncbi:MAG: zinc-binding dehydrogenase [Chlamydiales bacterium]
MKTQAAVLNKQNAPLEIWDLEIPFLQSGQVLVKIAYSGFCRTQLNEIHGLKGYDRFIPHTLGHEGSGVVEAIGPDVKKVKEGDRVVLSWIKGQGADISQCKYGIVNSGAISTFMTHAVISENRVVPIPHKMPLREAALLGCTLPTGGGVVKNEMQLEAGSSFAFFGAGGVGLSALLMAKDARASLRIAIDINESKLIRASNCGATHLINALHRDPVSAIFEITSGEGVDYVLESAGQRQAMEQAFRSLKVQGGLCVLAGNLSQGESISIDPFELICGKKMIGTWGGNSNIDRDVPYYVDLYLKGRIDLSCLITHEVPLIHINELISDLESDLVGRGLVRCS